MDFKSKIRTVEDFPKPGISFKDITTLLQDGEAFHAAIETMAAHFEPRGIDMVTGPEARGYIFASALAYRLRAGFVPIRKPGKLPWKTRSISYQLEYGEDTLEVHEDAFQPGQKVLVVDDLLATGGTIAACCNLVEKLGANVVGCCFLIHLAFLSGAKKIEPREIFSLLRYD